VDLPQVCDAWPVRHKTYGYLLGRKSYIISTVPNYLLDDKGTYVSGLPQAVYLSASAVGET